MTDESNDVDEYRMFLFGHGMAGLHDPKHLEAWYRWRLYFLLLSST